MHARLFQRRGQLAFSVSDSAQQRVGVNGQQPLEAWITGERDPRWLAELARLLKDQIDALSAQISTLTGRVEDLIVERARLSAIQRLNEITGVGALNAQVIIAAIGLDMTRFPTPGHLVAWAKLCSRIV